MNPLVSVIIPNYNHAPFLKERIDSVISQTYDNFEVIILDDCSSDNSVVVIETYRNHPRVKEIVINTTNSGSTFVQWQKGFALAQGEYLWIAESDDVADPTFLQEAMTRIIANPGSVLAYCRSQMIDQDGNPLARTWDKPKRFHSNGVYPGHRFCLERLMYKNLLYNASMIVFKRSAIANVNSDYLKFKLCGDWMFWYQICRQGTVIEIPLVLNKYRQHTNKVSNRAIQEGFNLSEALKCQTMISKDFKLSKYKTLCLKGRMYKRLKKISPERKRLLKKEFPYHMNGNLLHFCLYEIDKAFKISKMI